MSIAEAKAGRRFNFAHVGSGKRRVALRADHPAVVEGRTLFPTRVFAPDELLRVLKSGTNSRKIGGLVTKGKWRGFPIFTLTLEERKTCPSICAQWRTCYGGGMQYAQRIEHGPELESALDRELTALARAHPKGFVVRLHVLGDFYSVKYVELWFDWLDRFPNLHIFGYTAHPVHSPIGKALAWCRDHFWERFAVRTSDGNLADASTVTLKNYARGRQGSAIVCPAQTKDADCCATCGLCWQSRVNICFLQH